MPLRVFPHYCPVAAASRTRLLKAGAKLKMKPNREVTVERIELLGILNMDALYREAQPALSERELSALKTIGRRYIGVDFWEDETIERYRRLGLVTLRGKRIILTAAGRRANGRPRNGG